MLEFHGRQDFQIKFFGTRLELTDIEAALGAQDSVAECAVVPMTDHNGLVMRLMAYVVARGTRAAEDPDVLGAAWRAGLRRRFGRLMPPVTFRTLASLPRNVGGKVDRRRLPAPASLRAPARPRPPTRTEHALALAQLWCELLAVDEVDAEDSFFALGGDSLLAPVLLHRVRERLRAEVPLYRFLADPTLAGLRDVVDATGAAPAEETNAIRKDEVEAT